MWYLTLPLKFSQCFRAKYRSSFSQDVLNSALLRIYILGSNSDLVLLHVNLKLNIFLNRVKRKYFLQGFLKICVLLGVNAAWLAG